MYNIKRAEEFFKDKNFRKNSDCFQNFQETEERMFRCREKYYPWREDLKQRLMGEFL